MKENNIKRNIHETTVFGERVDENQRKGGSNPILGVTLILAGAIVLANHAGVLPYQIWEVIIRYWPVLLILFGIRVIIGRSWAASALMTLLTILVLGVVVIIGISETNPALITQMGIDKIQWYNFIDYLKIR